METVSRDEIIERICNCLEEMSNEDLETLYNKEFGDGLKYVDNDEFSQENNCED